MDGAEVAARFGLGERAQLVGPVARGHQGEVWRLDTADGCWAVKRSFVAQAERDVAEGAAFQEAARAGGVRTPRLVRTVDGQVLAEVALGQVRVDEWVELQPPDPRVDPAVVGETIAAIHRTGFGGTNPVDPWYVEPVAAGAWAELLTELERAGAPFAAAVRAAAPELVAFADLAEPPAELRTCHRDLFADNLRAGAVGDDLWVIDWNDCGLTDPTFELALVIFEFAYDDTDRARALHAAYRNAGGPARLERVGQCTTVAAQLGHILEISCRRWLASDDPEVRATNERRVHEYLGQPPSRALFERMVEATATT